MYNYQIIVVKNNKKFRFVGQYTTKEKAIIVDVDGYKKRQEESVLRLAERKAEYAIETQKEIKLPPMNPYFRRKVHLFLADKFKDKVTTESTGEGQDRAIKIIPQ